MSQLLLSNECVELAVPNFFLESLELIPDSSMWRSADRLRSIAQSAASLAPFEATHNITEKNLP